MSRSHEQLSPDTSGLKEQEAQTVERFMSFTKTVLSTESHSLDVEWEHQMNMLLGNEELLRVTKNEAYRGVPGVKDDLRSAYESGGIANLKAAFIVKITKQPSVTKMGDALQTALRKIVDFE